MPHLPRTRPVVAPHLTVDELLNYQTDQPRRWTDAQLVIELEIELLDRLYTPTIEQAIDTLERLCGGFLPGECC